MSIATLRGDHGILTQANKANVTNIEGRVREEVQLAVQAANLAINRETANNYSWSAVKDGIKGGAITRAKTSTFTDETTNGVVLRATIANDLRAEGYYIAVTAITTVDNVEQRTITIEYEGDDYKKATNNPDAKITYNLKVTQHACEIEGITNGGNLGEDPTPPDIGSVTPGEIVTGKNKEYTTEDGTAVIPVGFAIVPGLDDISEGLVISDDPGDTEADSSNMVANGNQFVWVPVSDIGNFHTIEGYYNGSLDSKLSNCSEPYTSGYDTEVSEYESMKLSVEMNDGFYIGRFEAGKDSSGNVVVKKGATVYKNIPWGTSMDNITGGAVEKAKNFTKGKSYESSVTSTLCYGVQWDAAMQFMDSDYINGECAEGSYVRKSTGKGNYKETENTNSWKGNVTETGKLPEYAVKNIYDMAGNVSEWTMEAYSTDRRVLRGGYFNHDGSNISASYRGYGPSTANDDVGFRVALYL